MVALFEEDYEWYNATVVQDPVLLFASRHSKCFEKFECGQDKSDGSFVVLWDDPDGGPELAVCFPEHLRTPGCSLKLAELQRNP